MSKAVMSAKHQEVPGQGENGCYLWTRHTSRVERLSSVPDSPPPGLPESVSLSGTQPALSASPVHGVLRVATRGRT